VIEEPPSARRCEIVVADAAAGFRRVNDPTPADVDRDVIDSAFVLKQHEVTWSDDV
jgi:hypothetical protein